MHYKISIIIALSSDRIELFLARALQSVYKQQIPLNLKQSIKVLVVCDDFSLSQKQQIENGITQTRDALNMQDTFPTIIVENTRTKRHSGTGAWNSGAFSCIDTAMATNAKHYLAFLDDDDSWEENYLQECYSVLETSHNCIGLIASGIIRHQDNEEKELLPCYENLHLDYVFVKNPCIQGSNLFINLEVFLSLGGFDESMPSTTDRDLIMRYLQYTKLKPSIQTHIIPKSLVHHFADSNRKRVTNNHEAKHHGLALFYRKYIHDFNTSLQEKSLKRAKGLFGFDKNLYYNTDKTNKQTHAIALESSVTNIHLLESNIIAINLILAFACFDSKNCKQLLQSLIALKPQSSKALKDFHICLLTCDSLEYELTQILKNYSIPFHIKSIEEKPSIANSRTLLQRFTFEIGKELYTDFVTWIIDDDLTFKGFDGKRFYHIDYFSHIASYANEGIDCLLGGVSGEPPLPFLSILRTQLLDLYFSLQPYNYAFKGIEIKGEYYYDLSSVDFKYLEFPFLESKEAQSILECLNNNRIATRKLTCLESQIGELCKDSIYRGGNTIIYNPILLTLDNFTPDSKSYNRRSDFNWAIMQSKLYKRSIKTIMLPLFHERKKMSIDCEIEKLESDLIGMIFYRIFLRLCESSDQEILSYAKTQELFNDELHTLKTKLIANIYRIEALDMLIYSRMQQPLKESYFTLSKTIYCLTKSLKRFCQTQQSLSKEIYKQCIDKIHSSIGNQH